MTAITGNFPPGPYTATYADANGTAQSVGLMEGPIRHQQNVIGLPVRCSAYGQNIIDYVMQGGGVFVVLTIKEWSTNTKFLMHSFNASMGIFPVPGTMFSSFCHQLVLTALTGTPAATYGPVTRTYPLAAILPGHNLDLTFGPNERNIPIVMGVLPEINGSTVGSAKYFTDT